MSGNGSFHDDSHSPGGRMLRVETDQMLLRRDLTALLAANREMLERMTELATLVHQGLAASETCIGRLDVIDDSLGRLRRAVRELSRGINVRKK